MMLKWIVRGLLALLSLAVVGIVGVYAASEVVIRRHYETPASTLVITADAAAIERGAHLGQTRGCSGCHQPNLQGEKWFDDVPMGRLYPTNLTHVLVDYSDAELDQAIRHGVRRDGSALWEMPSSSFANLTDQDTADIIAWLRTNHPPAGEPTPYPAFGPVARLLILTGKLRPIPARLEAAIANPAFDAGPEFIRGRYIARTVCSNCHGSNLGGDPAAQEPTPDLIVASAYDLPGFMAFLRTGVAADGKDKGLMSEVARDELSHFTDAEIADLHAYLVARAERAPPPAT